MSFVVDTSVMPAWCLEVAYLELALRNGVPLATLDTSLAAAATTLGVPVVTP